MGYDCTLHVVDEAAIRKIFIPKLLGTSNARTVLDRVHGKDAAEMWKTVRESLAGQDAREAASLVCQLAVMFSGCHLLHHYERGFALSLWPGQAKPCAATVPAKLTDSPESLFAAVVRRYPKLKGKFPRRMSGNYSTGIYVPARHVPALLAWVRARVTTYAEDDRERFYGLLAILREAARRKLAYWEATDLTVPIANQLGGKAALMTADFLTPAKREKLPPPPPARPQKPPATNPYQDYLAGLDRHDRSLNGMLWTLLHFPFPLDDVRAVRDFVPAKERKLFDATLALYDGNPIKLARKAKDPELLLRALRYLDDRRAKGRLGAAVVLAKRLAIAPKAGKHSGSLAYAVNCFHQELSDPAILGLPKEDRALLARAIDGAVVAARKNRGDLTIAKCALKTVGDALSLPLLAEHADVEEDVGAAEAIAKRLRKRR